MPNLLIVDDEPTIRMLFQYVFLDAGYTVEMAENGADALEKLKTYTPDIMLVDISMPVMDGRGFAEGLQKAARLNPKLKNIPFLVMTGENFMNAELNSFFKSKPGFKTFLPKMTAPEKVLELAQSYLTTNT